MQQFIMVKFTIERERKSERDSIVRQSERPIYSDMTDSCCQGKLSLKRLFTSNYLVD